ncbi:hypothetical protein D3C80_1745640 [compost metagenome]
MRACGAAVLQIKYFSFIVIAVYNAEFRYPIYGTDAGINALPDPVDGILLIAPEGAVP